jgi:hypothetical protein
MSFNFLCSDWRDRASVTDGAGEQFIVEKLACKFMCNAPEGQGFRH